jgi:hypothetical protein
MNPQPIQNLGKGGLNKDTPRALLPPNVFTDVLNVRFKEDSVFTIQGEETEFTTTEAPIHGIHWPRTDSNPQAILLDDNGKIVRRTPLGVEATMFNNASHANGLWQSDLFGGGYAVIVNNGLSTPLYCLQDGPGTTDTAFEEFPGWNYGTLDQVTAKVIRPFGYALVAANLTLTEGAVVTQAPVTLRISTQAPIGGFPATWEPGLTADTADEFEVNSSDPIQDMAELRGNLLIYCETSIHMLVLLNGIAAVRPYAKDYGLLGVNCVATFNNQHFCVDRNDIYVHNGSGKIDSVAEGRLRDFFLADCDFTLAERVFVYHNRIKKEIWLCYHDNTVDAYAGCNKALIYNYVDDNFTVRQLPHVTHIMSSPRIGTDEYIRNTENYWMLTGEGTVRTLDRGWQMWDRQDAEYKAITSYVERVGMTVDGNPFTHASIQGLAPLLESLDTNPVGPEIYIQVTGQNIYDQVANWYNPSNREVFTINPRDTNTGYMVNPRISGRFLNWRLWSDRPWRLSFMVMDVKVDQRR